MGRLASLEGGGICRKCHIAYESATLDRFDRVHFDCCPSCLNEEFRPRKKGCLGKFVEKITQAISPSA